MSTSHKARILVIDDNAAIHDDFRQILCPGTEDLALAEAEAALFGDEPNARPCESFEIDAASQGQQGLEKVEHALQEGRPYALAFVDVRMPPGWDGVETVSRIWKVCPQLQIVICTAYSDCSWDNIVKTLGHSDNLVILKKPFDTIEVMQLAHALTGKWRLAQEVQAKMVELGGQVTLRTQELENANQLLRTEATERRLSEERFAQAFSTADPSHLENRLRQAHELQAAGQLASGVAHDFNDLLTVIQGHVSLLLHSPGAQRAPDEPLKQTLLAAEQAAALTRRLDASSRPSATPPPAIDATTQAAPRSRQTEFIFKTPSPPGRGRTILLVEDQPLVREMVRTILVGWNYEVIEAGDSAEALQRWTEIGGAVDLLLTDVVMPNGIDGRALAKLLLAQRPQLKVIYTTGYTAEVLGDDALEREGVRFLSKPYQIKTLLRAVQDCLETSGAGLAP